MARCSMAAHEASVRDLRRSYRNRSATSEWARGWSHGSRTIASPRPGDW